MSMSLFELREKVRAVVLRGISIDEFEDWLVAHSWDMHQWAAPEIQRLVSYLELRLAEHSSEHLSADELLHEFALRLAQLDAPLKPFAVGRVSFGDASIVESAASGASGMAVHNFKIKLAERSDLESSSESRDDSLDLTCSRRSELTA